MGAISIKRKGILKLSGTESRRKDNGMTANDSAIIKLNGCGAILFCGSISTHFSFVKY